MTPIMSTSKRPAGTARATWTSSSRGIIVTWSQQTDVFAAIIGKFNLKSGQFLVHSFDGDCNHVSSENLNPQNPGFSTDIDVGRNSVTVDVACFDNACGDRVTTGHTEVSGGGVAMADCDDQVTWVGCYAYKMCGFLHG